MLSRHLNEMALVNSVFWARLAHTVVGKTLADLPIVRRDTGNKPGATFTKK